MRAVAAVDGNCGPTVIENANFGAAGVDHWFNGEDHAGLEAWAFAGVAKVGYLGVFVHGAAYAVSNELADDAEALSLAQSLDGGGDVAEAATDLTLLDRLFEGGEGHFEEFRSPWGRPARSGK